MRMTDEMVAAFGPRRIAPVGRALIKEFEGLKLRAYRCPAGMLTIGYGHTRTVKPEQTISKERAEELLTEDLVYFEKIVSDTVRVSLNDHQFSALVSFCFNVGAQNFTHSTLLKLLNRGWYDQVPAQLLRWTRVGGEAMGGLVRRRAAEARLWSTTP
ncbi:MAG: lysozyme [Alphaproteobacteria bacterium]|nr:lysozyme [Alphaproteobacteria bacterium]NDC55785.1 lysozyme [Alphaproteobacteria bacterium]NDG03815.1 lysozyme [Alphaproteobacteria bacterium]